MPDPVLVLGAGIVGLCSALALAERGYPVQVVDRKAPGQETSYGNAGVISPWSVVPQSMPGLWSQIPKLMFGRYKPLSVRAKAWPQMVPWGLAFLRNGSEAKARRTSDAMSLLCGPSIELYERYLHEAGAAHLISQAMYVHAYRDGSKATLKGLEYDIRRQKGCEMEIIGADALRQTEPALSHDFQAAVLIKGQARARSPEEVCKALARRAGQLGVQFATGDIQSLTKQGERWHLRCDSSEFSAAHVVVALGVWSRDLLARLGISMPLMAERGYHVEYAQPGVEVGNSIMDTDAKVVASSMLGGLRVAGQAEFGPIDAPADPRKPARLRSIARAMFPDLDVSEEKSWMGRRPSFPDSLPVIGAVRGQEGLYVNFGHSHYGLMMAPKSGQVLASIVTGKPQNQDLAAFDPDRFS